MCTKVGSTEKSVALWSAFLPFGTHLCVCFVAHCGPSVCVSTQQTQSQCPWWVYLLVVQEVVLSFCSVWPYYRQREGLQSPLLTPIRGKHFVIFILRHILSGSSNQWWCMERSGAECRLTGEKQIVALRKNWSMTWPVNRWEDNNTNCYESRIEYCGIDSRSSGSLYWQLLWNRLA